MLRSYASRFSSFVLIVLASLYLQACNPKLLVSAGSSQNSQQGQSNMSPVGENIGTPSGSTGVVGQASGEVTVSGSTDWLEDEVECDTEGRCSRWVEL
jgi:hypothetical protein